MRIGRVRPLLIHRSATYRLVSLRERVPPALPRDSMIMDAASPISVRRFERTRHTLGREPGSECEAAQWTKGVGRNRTDEIQARYRRLEVRRQRRRRSDLRDAFVQILRDEREPPQIRPVSRA